ncbi:uncharacterized protein LOC125941139 [Dermacentor silvarum]|uniref:uncharacterized protein LOC125941139 n=1 Tax=Dermacentor silvarum TaxID=543639 RepID=UPI002100DDE0|nr:uncharacterized protein LOC125941139 [Dermacentor silvarum]
MDLGSKFHGFVSSFLRGRRATLKVGEVKSDPFELGARGTPEGSVISPLLFNVAIRGLSARLSEVDGVNHALHTNDITVWCDGGSEGRVEESLQAALSCTEDFLAGAGLQLSPSKSELFLYRPTRRGRIPKGQVPLEKVDISIRMAIGQVIPKVVEAQQIAQVVRLSSSPAGRRILEALGCNLTVVRKRRSALDTETREAIRVSPFPRNVYPQHNCLKGVSLTVEELNIPEEEILIATWEAGDLVKKVLDADTFLNHLRVLVAKWIVHNHIKKTQGKAIYEEKQCTQRGSIVFHFDFAENWTVVLPDEVQAYHWKKQQVSVFTCVVTTKKSTESFAIVSDDLNHDSAHACLALKKATEWVDDNLPVYSKVTYVSDGAASHFKNRYRLYEFGKSDCPNTQWIFSATGHGKNTCDGVGGLVKHQAMLNNLRTNPESAIRAARDFVTILTEKLKGAHLIHLEEKEVVAFRDLKKDEWMKVPAFHGIQSWHAWQLSRSTEASPELYVARIAGSAWKKLCVQE